MVRLAARSPAGLGPGAVFYVRTGAWASRCSDRLWEGLRGPLLGTGVQKAARVTTASIRTQYAIVHATFGSQTPRSGSHFPVKSDSS